MHQTKLVSLIEVCVNVATGFVLAWLTWMYVIPMIWPNLAGSASQGFWVTAVFTVVSITRGYVWRRFFNAGFHHAVVNWVGKFWWRKSQKLGCENMHLGCALGNKPCPKCGNDIWVKEAT